MQLKKLSSENFEEIFQLIKDDVRKQNTKTRESISPRLKIAAATCFLSTGESYKSFQFLVRIHNITLSLFVPKAC